MLDEKLLEASVKEGRNNLTADKLDMSFGELMNLYSDGELIIDPAFQRLFRWSVEQRSRFIESILLGIPIPSIFVAEDNDGKWEVVDGLQRISTILSFVGLLKNNSDKNGWKMTICDLIQGIDDVAYEEFPLKYKLTIKRAFCRIEVIKWDSAYDMRYELFKRLNTGGSLLTNQEIRNCIFRGVSPDFTNQINNLAMNQDFIEIIKPTKKQKQELYLDELVLRFFSLFDNEKNVKKNISEHMSDYMHDATKNPQLNEGKEQAFLQTLSLVKTCNNKAFVGKNNTFSSSLYDGIMIGIASHLPFYEKNHEVVKGKITKIKNDTEFKQVSGSSSSYRKRVEMRIERALEIFGEYENS